MYIVNRKVIKMLIGFIMLVIITVCSVLIPLYMKLNGFMIPDWFWGMLGSFIGSAVAILGSVSFQLLTEKRKNERLYEKNLLLLKQELYNNFIVSVHRVINSSEKIDIFEQAYKNFITMGEASLDKDRINTFSEISKLYFIISRGHQTLKTAKVFLDEVFNLQMKRPRSFQEVKEIIQSSGIDYIYEFAIIRYIILLNRNHKLNVVLPFNDYEKVIIYKQGKSIDIEDNIINYITELVCKKVFENDRTLHYLE